MICVLGIKNKNQCLSKYKAEGYIPSSDMIVSKEIYEKIQPPVILEIENGQIVGWESFTPEPETEPERPKTELEILQDENKKLAAKINTLTQSNQMLEDCVVEMAGIVYA